jgi:hypothetical protein
VKQNIALRLTDYTVIFVESEIFGKFGVHLSIQDDKHYVVTLLDVGLCIGKGYKLSKGKAIKLAKELDVLDVQWPSKYQKGMGAKKTRLLTKSYNLTKPILDKYR